MTRTDAFAVKVRRGPSRRFAFLTPSRGLTGLWVHAAIFQSLERATDVAQDVLAANDDVTAVRVVDADGTPRFRQDR